MLMQCLVFFAVILAALILGAIVLGVGHLLDNWKDRQSKRRWEEYDAKVLEQCRPWLDKLESLKHLLTGEDWTSPDGKKEFVRQIFGDRVPMYLWYVMSEKLSDIEVRYIVTLFWPTSEPTFGDVELHGKKLRIRNAEKFLSEVELFDNTKLPLCQVGYSQFGGPEEGCVNFMTLKPERQLEKVG